MRKLLRILVIGLGFLLAYQMQVNAQIALPYTEDFETLTTCGTFCGAACPLTNGWINDLNDDIDWTVDTGGTGSGVTGPAIDHNPGTSTGNYLYTETSGCNGDTALLISPAIDLTTAQIAEVSYWYHMWGATQGEFHVDISADSGATWVLDITPAEFGDHGDIWINNTIKLAAWATDTVMLRFRAITGTSFTSDLAVDDVSFYALQQLDAGVSQFINPGEMVCEGTEAVMVEIKNYGIDTIFSTTVNWTINGVAQTAASLTGLSIPCGTVDTVMIGNITTVGGTNYTLVANTTNPNGMTDGQISNDSSSHTVSAVPIISTFPYLENFDSGPGGWTSTGAVNNWQLGTPNGLNIIGSFSGAGAWITDTISNFDNNHDGYVISPCLDMTSINQPIVQLRVWWDSPFSQDGATLQASNDAGNTWTTVGAFGDPDNWYTDNTVDGLTQFGFGTDGWTGAGTTGSGGWLLARHAVPSLANAANARLRIVFASNGFTNFGFDGFAFDDFEIFERPAIDAKIEAIIDPSSGCGLGIDSVRIMYSNQGSTAWGNTSLSYRVNGGAPVTEIDSRILNPGDSVIYTFTVPANLSVVGNYIIDAWVDKTGDPIASNDSTSKSIDNFVAVTTFPYLENFDSGPGGWISGGGTNNWQLGTPNGAVIDTPATAPNSWITDTVTNYANNHDGWVLSPCMDMSSLNQPIVRLSVWWDTEFSWDGAVLQGSDDAGVTWSDIGSVGDPDNWYNDGTIVGLSNAGASGEGWSGVGGTGSGGWLTARHDIPQFANEPNARFRILFGSDGSVNFGFDGIAFDDFEIFDAPPMDAEMLQVVTPVSGCALGTDSVRVMYKNRGSATWSGAVLSYSINGAAAVSQTDPTSLAPGDTTIFTFSTTTNLSAVASYDVDVWVDLMGDPDQLNDSLLNHIAVHKPSISSFPYIENFDGPAWVPDNTNFAPGAPIIAVGPGWENVQGENATPQDWAIRSAATGSNAFPGTGPAADHTTGLSNYVFVEDNGPFENDSVMLVTPCFDISGLLNPELSFWIHSNNANDPDNPNELHLDIFTNGQWTQDIIAPISHRNNMWNQVVLPLVPYIPAGDISFRFRVNNNNPAGFGGHDIAIDDFIVTEILPNDMGVAVVNSPTSGCGLTATEPINVIIENFGVLAQDSVEVAYVINGGVPVVETVFFTPPLGNGGIFPYTFTTTADFSVPGLYTIEAYTQNVTGDTNIGNDSSSRDLEHIITISSYPYLEDFESGNGGWNAVGNAPSPVIWELGAPINTIINSAASGVNAWVTDLDDLYPANADAYVVGPCFDFSTLVVPKIEMAVWWDAEFSWDGAVLQSSVDTGLTWINVGAFGDPNNWYNDNTIAGAPGGSQEGWTGSGASGSGGWVTAKHDLDSLGGESHVLLRVAFGSDGFGQNEGFAFDDIFILETPGDDVGVIDLVTPTSSACGDSSTVVTVSIVNFGLNAQTNIPVTVNLSPGTPLMGTFPGPLNSGDTATFVVGTFNSASGGLVSFTAYTTLAGDQVNLNDTIFATSDLAPVTPVPVAMMDTVILCIPDSTILGVVNDTNFSYTWYDTIVGGLPLASDTNLYQTPFLTNDVTYYVDAMPGGAGPNIRITETELGFPDYMEVQNTGNTPVDVSGWVVAFGEDIFGTPNINTVAGTLWTMSGIMQPGEIRFRNDDGTSPNYIGQNILWNPSAEGWVLILDANNTVVDFLVFNYSDADIMTFAPTIRGTVIDITGQWSGPGASAAGFTNIYRVGSTDDNDATNFTGSGTGAFAGMGTLNPGLNLPLTGGGSGGCPSDRIAIHVLVAPPVPVDLGPDGAACAGIQVDATTAGAASYLWSNGFTTPSITVQMSGQYSVIVTNADGCTGADTINLLIQPSPTVGLGNDTTVCGEILLDAGNPGSSYAWCNGDQTQTSLATTSGQYCVLVTNPSGCTDTDTINVTVLPAPNVDLGPDVSECEMVTLDAGAGAQSYAWGHGPMTQTVTVSTSGLYTVIATGANGCEDTDDIVVNILPNPDVNLGGDTVFCDDGILDAGNPGSSYTWTDGSMLQTLLVSTSGNYGVTVTDANGCMEADTVNVTVEPIPMAAFSWIFTSAATVDLTNASNLTGPGFTYLWKFGDGNTSTMENPTHTYNQAGNYQITLIITSPNCGVDSVTIPALTSIDDLFGESIELFPNPNTGKFSVLIEGINAPDLSVRVSDVAGKLVYEHNEGRFNGNFEHQVDLTRQAEGVYMVQISDGERTAYKKVVVER